MRRTLLLTLVAAGLFGISAINQQKKGNG